LRNGTREPETADRSKRTTNCHNKIAEHEKFLTRRRASGVISAENSQGSFPKPGTANSIASAIGKR
jgi:hypothetical protein